MKQIYTLLFLFVVVFFWSIINPTDPLTCFFEVVPTIVGLAVLTLTFKRFRFTNFVYTFIFIHCCILLIGGHYTYAEVPLFDWIKETFNQSRNNYDKVGHFAQGFIPALITREIFIRNKVVNGRKWLNTLTISVCLSISLIYEIIEWWVALATGAASKAFLGMQGYEWDTQSDMFYALIGAIAALLVFSQYHDKKIQEHRHKTQTTK